MTPHNPLFAARHIQSMANEVRDNRIGTAFMVMSGALLLLMLIKEGKELFVSKPAEHKYQPATDYQKKNLHGLQSRVHDRDEATRHQR